MNATSNCPYGECDGSGISWREVEGKKGAAYCKCRNELINSKRIKFANIPDEFKDLKINSFDTELYESKDLAILAKKAAINYIKNFQQFKELGKGIYFYSKVKGSGKTRLAVSIGNAIMTVHKIGVKFIKTAGLIKEIQSTYNKESKYTESELINAINEVPVLIMDDLGVEKQSDFVNEILYQIIDNRMIKKKITIFTSNVKIEELKHDDRIINRIEKIAIPINLPDESIRSKLAKKENEDLQSILYK